MCSFVVLGAWRALREGSGAGQQLAPPGQKDDIRDWKSGGAGGK